MALQFVEQELKQNPSSTLVLEPSTFDHALSKLPVELWTLFHMIDSTTLEIDTPDILDRYFRGPTSKVGPVPFTPTQLVKFLYYMSNYLFWSIYADYPVNLSGRADPVIINGQLMFDVVIPEMIKIEEHSYQRVENKTPDLLAKIFPSQLLEQVKQTFVQTLDVDEARNVIYDKYYISFNFETTMELMKYLADPYPLVKPPPESWVTRFLLYLSEYGRGKIWRNQIIFHDELSVPGLAELDKMNLITLISQIGFTVIVNDPRTYDLLWSQH